MATLTSNVNAFDKRLYQAISERAAKYHREMPAVSIIPAKQLQFNVNQYKKPIYGESVGVQGGEPSLEKEMMLTPKSHKVYDLKNVNAYIYWDQDDLMEQNGYLQQQKDEQLSAWARIANISLWKGVYDKGYNSSGVGQGKKLINGFLDDASSVIDLDGTDSVLASSGDVYKALVKMITSIPYRYVQGKEIVLGMTPHFYDMANSTTFTNTSGLTEWEQFYRIHMDGVSPYQVSKNVIFSNDLFLQSTDTLNTNDRLVAFITDPNIVERAYSRGFGLMGEAKNYVGGITQSWTVKLAGCVHDSNAFLFSEQIAWS